MMELFHYVNQSPPPSDIYSAQITLNYLEARNKIFEEGFLSHSTVTQENQDILRSISNGFDFFVKWIDSLLEGSV